MPIAKSTGSSDHPPIPAGTALAICYGCIDIGTPPPHGNFPSRRKVRLLFELPHLRADFTKEGETKNCARVISEKYTLSTDKKANLRKLLASWRGKDFTEVEAKAFDVSKVVGAMALLSIVHKPSADGSRIYANIGGIMKPMAGTEKMKPENPVVIYDIPATGKIEIPTTIPEWIGNEIKVSDEYVARSNPNHLAQNGGGASQGPADNVDPSVDPDAVPF